jgi:hypothetical protein
MVVLEVGGPLLGARGGPSARTLGQVMNTPIKIKKRDEEKVTQHAENASPLTPRRRTTEIIVKSWIIESRERRRSDLNRFRNSVLRKD